MEGLKTLNGMPCENIKDILLQKVDQLKTFIETHIQCGEVTTTTTAEETFGFKTEWTVSGDATARTITLPLYNSGTFNCTVDWGDGSSISTITAYNDSNRIHTYSSDGTYTVEIKGDCPSWSFNNAGDKLKIVKILNWGEISVFSKFTYLANGFYGCTNLTECPDYLDASSVSSLNGFFKSCTSLSSVQSSNWNTSGVTDMGNMFYGCTSITTVDVSGWDVSNVTTFGLAYDSGMFGQCSNITSLNVSSWVFSSSSNITCGGMFANCSKLSTLDVSNWNTEKFISTVSMFRYLTTSITLDLSNWDVSSITNFGNSNTAGMFYNSTGISSLNLANWRFSTTSNVATAGMFRGCSNLTTIGDTTSWNTEKWNNVEYMFEGCQKLTSLNVTNWTTTQLTSLSYLFANCYALVSTIANPLDVSSWNVSNVTNFTAAFASCRTAVTFPVTNWDVSKGTNFGSSWPNGMFYDCREMTTLPVSTWTFSSTSSITMYSMFASCKKLATLDVSAWNVGKVTNFGAMFRELQASITLDLSTWNVSAGISFGGSETEGMFYNATGITSLNLASWSLNTSSNIAFCGVFNGCSNLTTIGDISGWNTSKITNISYLFFGCTQLSTISFANWNLSSCSTFSNFMNGCAGLTTIDASNWTLNTTSNVNMSSMFSGCSNVTTITITNWNTSKVTNLLLFLNNCAKLTTIDVSIMNVSSCTNCSWMFSNCLLLNAIDISGWNMSNVTSNAGMFNACSSLSILTVPSSLNKVETSFAAGLSAITVYNFYPSTAPTVSGTPFGNYAKPLHVPVSNSGYNVSPWTNTAIFSSIINDL